MKKIGFFIFSIFNTIILLGQNNGLIDNLTSKIYYETFGEGNPILIINGGPGMNSKGFRSIAGLLSKNHKAIIYDQRGTGNSSMKIITNETITMDLMVSDIERLRKHLNIKHWIVLGHSFGGILGSYYTSKHPDRVKGLILSSSGGLDLGFLNYVGQAIANKLTKQERDLIQEWNQKISRGDTTHYARLQRGKALAPAYVVDKKYVPVIAERLTQGNQNINRLVYQDLRRIKYDCTQPLKSFHNPVLIIQGNEDIIEEKTAKKAHQVFPNSKLVLLDDCGHYGWLDAQKEYLSEINTFLEKI